MQRQPHLREPRTGLRQDFGSHAPRPHHEAIGIIDEPCPVASGQSRLAKRPQVAIPVVVRERRRVDPALRDVPRRASPTLPILLRREGARDRPDLKLEVRRLRFQKFQTSNPRVSLNHPAAAFPVEPHVRTIEGRVCQNNFLVASYLIHGKHPMRGLRTSTHAVWNTMLLEKSLANMT